MVYICLLLYIDLVELLSSSIHLYPCNPCGSYIWQPGVTTPTTSNAVELWVLSLERRLGEGEARARARNLLHDLVTHFVNRRKEGPLLAPVDATPPVLA